MAGRVTDGRRKRGIEGDSAIGEDLEGGLIVFETEAGVVGGAFVGEMIRGGQRVVMNEIIGVAEDGFKDASGLRCFQGAVKVGDEIGGGEMDFVVERIRGRADGCRVGGPHAGGA